jgi:hypothetical protein
VTKADGWRAAGKNRVVYEQNRKEGKASLSL